MPFNPKSNKPAPNSITTLELAPDAVQAENIQDGAVMSPDAGINNDFSHTGVLTSLRVIDYEFIKDAANKRNVKKCRVYMDLGIDDAAETATAELWINGDANFDGNDNNTGGVPDATVTHTGDTVLTPVFMEVSVAGLADGKHKISIAIKTSDATKTVSTTVQDVDFSTSN